VHSRLDSTWSGGRSASPRRRAQQEDTTSLDSIDPPPRGLDVPIPRSDKAQQGPACLSSNVRSELPGRRDFLSAFAGDARG
jgi:hypothetical protein